MTGLNCSVMVQVFDVLGGAGTVVQLFEVTVKFLVSVRVNPVTATLDVQ